MPQMPQEIGRNKSFRRNEKVKHQERARLQGGGGGGARKKTCSEFGLCCLSGSRPLERPRGGLHRGIWYIAWPRGETIVGLRYECHDMRCAVVDRSRSDGMIELKIKLARNV